MFSIIHKHVTRLLFGSLLLCVAVVLGLTVLLDFVQRVDDFSELLQNASITWTFIVRFYAIRLPMFAVWLAPIILLAAAGVTLIRLNRKNELVPFLMSGMSLHRMLIPLYVFLSFAAAGVFSVQEWMLPSLSRELAVTKKRLKEGNSMDDVLAVDDRGRYLHSRSMDIGRNVLRNVTLLTFDDSELKRIVTAEQARWNSGGKHWRLFNGRLVNYDEKGFRAGAPVNFGNDGPVWKTDLAPDLILARESPMEFYRLPTLLDMIDRWPHLIYLRMKLHTRLVYPVITFLLPLFAIPVLLRREIRSYLLGSIALAGIAVGYYLIQLVFMELGSGGLLHPILAAWVPVLAAGSWVLYLMDDVLT